MLVRLIAAAVEIKVKSVVKIKVVILTKVVVLVVNALRFKHRTVELVLR